MSIKEMMRGLGQAELAAFHKLFKKSNDFYFSLFNIHRRIASNIFIYYTFS